MIVVALADTTVFVGGMPVHLQRGQAWSSDAEVVKKNPALFSRFERDAAGHPVEQATAAPGELRGAPRAR